MIMHSNEKKPVQPFKENKPYHGSDPPPPPREPHPMMPRELPFSGLAPCSIYGTLSVYFNRLPPGIFGPCLVDFVLYLPWMILRAIWYLVTGRLTIRAFSVCQSGLDSWMGQT